MDITCSAHLEDYNWMRNFLFYLSHCLSVRTQKYKNECKLAESENSKRDWRICSDLDARVRMHGSNNRWLVGLEGDGDIGCILNPRGKTRFLLFEHVAIHNFPPRRIRWRLLMRLVHKITPIHFKRQQQSSRIYCLANICARTTKTCR